MAAPAVQLADLAASGCLVAPHTHQPACDTLLEQLLTRGYALISGHKWVEDGGELAAFWAAPDTDKKAMQPLIPAEGCGYRALPGNRQLLGYRSGPWRVEAPVLTAAQRASEGLDAAARQLLAAALRSQYLRLPGCSLAAALDDLPLSPHAWGSSTLQCFDYGEASSGSEAHVDKGLLTLIWAPGQPGLMVQNARGVWAEVPPTTACQLVVLPGRMLEYATCGLVKAATHRVVLGAGQARRSHVYKLSASPGATIHLRPAMAAAGHALPSSSADRYPQPASVQQVVDAFSATHQQPQEKQQHREEQLLQRLRAQQQQQGQQGQQPEQPQAWPQQQGQQPQQPRAWQQQQGQQPQRLQQPQMWQPLEGQQPKQPQTWHQQQGQQPQPQQPQAWLQHLQQQPQQSQVWQHQQGQQGQEAQQPQQPQAWQQQQAWQQHQTQQAPQGQQTQQPPQAPQVQQPEQPQQLHTRQQQQVQQPQQEQPAWPSQQVQQPQQPKAWQYQQGQQGQEAQQPRQPQVWQQQQAQAQKPPPQQQAWQQQQPQQAPQVQQTQQPPQAPQVQPREQPQQQHAWQQQRVQQPQQEQPAWQHQQKQQGQQVQQPHTWQPQQGQQPHQEPAAEARTVAAGAQSSAPAAAASAAVQAGVAAHRVPGQPAHQQAAVEQRGQQEQGRKRARGAGDAHLLAGQPFRLLVSAADDRNFYHFNVLPSSSWQAVAKAYCELRGLPLHRVVFVFNSVRIVQGTMAELGMADGDTVYAVLGHPDDQS